MSGRSAPTRPPAVASAAAPVRPRDGGFTLIELLVAMLIFATFLTMVTAASAAMGTGQRKAQAIGSSESQLTEAFLTLDRQVRYASAVNPAGTSGGSFYTEFQSTYTGTPQCTQLRYSPGTRLLQERSWTDVGPTVTLGAWTTLADGVVNASNPFALVPADATFVHQRLSVDLSVRAGLAGATTTSRSTVTFTAANSSAGSVTNDGVTRVCNDKGASRS